MKKIFISLVLTMIVVSGVSAQDGSYGGATNFASGEVGAFLIGGRYEKIIAPQISVGGVIYFSSFFILFNEMEVGAFGRYYIWNGLFGEVGLGYHIHTGADAIRGGMAISPGLGYKFDPGNPGQFFVTPGFTIPITIGEDNWGNTGVSSGFLIYCSLGYAW